MDMIVTLEGKSKVSAAYKGFIITTDQPEAAGGTGLAPAPFDLFLASIGTCAGYYIQSFCLQRGVDTAGIEIVQKMHYNKEERRISGIDIEVKLPASFPEKYREAVVAAANSCAVKKHINNAPEFRIVLV